MLMNGKEVNNIVIGGQTFVREGLVPGIYSFPNPSTSSRHEYNLTINNGIPSFSPIENTSTNSRHVVSVNVKKALVIKMIVSGNDTYVLVAGNSGEQSSDGSGLFQDSFVWIKLSEFGNKMVRLPDDLYQNINRYLQIINLP